MVDAPGPVGDCIHHHNGSLSEDRIDVLARQLSRSVIEQPAANRDMIVHTATDERPITWRDDLARTLQMSPLAEDPSSNLAALDAAIDEARAVAKRLGTGNHQIAYLETRHQKLVDQITACHLWIEDNADLIDRYTTVADELDRRIHARTLLYQHQPPDDVLAMLGRRAASTEARQWDAAVEVYARARLHGGPIADLTDPASYHTGEWRGIVLEAARSNIRRRSSKEPDDPDAPARRSPPNRAPASLASYLALPPRPR